MAAPPHSDVVRTTGLHYLQAGTGPAVVLLHGLAAFKEIWWGTIRALAPAFRAVAFDWPGHGASPGIDDYDFDRLASLAAASCEALGLDTITLVGHSLGGNIAARLALARPDLVRQLILVAPALDARHLARGWSRGDQPPYGERGYRILNRLLWPVAHYGSRVPHEHRGGVFRPLARRMHYAVQIDPVTLHRYSVALWASSLGTRIAAIRQPTLIVAGNRDALVSPAQAQEASRLIPHAELRILPGAFHNPMDERPVDFHAALLEWLRRDDAPAA